MRIYGSPTDNNAKLFKQGQDNILDPLIKAGKVEVIHEDWAADWRPEAAKQITKRRHHPQRFQLRRDPRFK